MQKSEKARTMNAKAQKKLATMLYMSEQLILKENVTKNPRL
jgi:hypothetical protein